MARQRNIFDHDLNAQQEQFCQLYVSREFFGNGVESYIEVYGADRSKPKWYQTACSSASRLLSSAKVTARINDLLDQAGLNDNFVDKQLLFLIQQHGDLGSKMRAITEYNKLKKRINDRPLLDPGLFAPGATKLTFEIVNGPQAQPDPEPGADPAQ